MAGPIWAQYWTLTKPRVVALIVFTAIIGMLLAIRPGDDWPWAQLLAGTLGGLLTTWVTFMPCFLWIFLGAPFIEVLRGNRALSGALSGEMVRW